MSVWRVLPSGKIKQGKVHIRVITSDYDEYNIKQCYADPSNAQAEAKRILESICRPDKCAGRNKKDSGEHLNHG